MLLLFFHMGLIHIYTVLVNSSSRKVSCDGNDTYDQFHETYNQPCNDRSVCGEDCDRSDVHGIHPHNLRIRAHLVGLAVEPDMHGHIRPNSRQDGF